MKRLTLSYVLITVFAISMATTAHASPWYGPGTGGGLDRRVERMTEQLDLTDAQQAQIRAILDEQRQQQALDRQAVRERIDGVLTPEQRAVRDQAAERRQQRRLERMADRLDLTPEQQTEVAALMQQKRTDPTMSRDQVRERMQDILDEDQLAELEALRDRRDNRHTWRDRGTD